MEVKMPEIVRLSPICMDSFQQHMAKRTISDLQLEVMTLRDLVKKLDPDHMYVFSPEYQAYIKTELPKDIEPEKLDRHKDESALQVISLTDFDPKLGRGE